MILPILLGSNRDRIQVHLAIWLRSLTKIMDGSMQHPIEVPTQGNAISSYLQEHWI